MTGGEVLLRAAEKARDILKRRACGVELTMQEAADCYLSLEKAFARDRAPTQALEAVYELYRQHHCVLSAALAAPPAPLSEAEHQRRSFAYGNAAIDNPDVTREMVDRAAAAPAPAAPATGEITKAQLQAAIDSAAEKVASWSPEKRRLMALETGATPSPAAPVAEVDFTLRDCVECGKVVHGDCEDVSALLAEHERTAAGLTAEVERLRRDVARLKDADRERAFYVERMAEQRTRAEAAEQRATRADAMEKALERARVDLDACAQVQEVRLPGTKAYGLRQTIEIIDAALSPQPEPHP